MYIEKIANKILILKYISNDICYNDRVIYSPYYLFIDKKADMKRSNNWYEDNKEEILKLYYDNKPIEEICDLLSCGRSLIYRKLNEWKVEKRERIKSQYRHNAKYNIDYKYFDNIDCEHKAYWLGMLLADGFVNEKEISLCLHISDLEMIKKFRCDIGSEHPIKYNKDGNPFITICCSYMCNTLIEYGFHNRKSWEFDIDKILKNIPYEYEHHFIRGMFDGDGCIKYYKYDYLNKPQLHFGYTGLRNVCEYVNLKLGIHRKLIHEGNLTYTTVTRDPKLLINIFDYLYTNADIYMDRKYNTFKEVKTMAMEMCA